MRTAAMILGIIGGVLDAIIGLLVIFGGAFMGNFIAQFGGIEGFDQIGTGLLTGVMIFVGVLILVVAILAIIGGANARKRPVLGGILMIIAGVLNIIGSWVGLIIALILIAGGILALAGAKELKAATPSTGA